MDQKPREITEVFTCDCHMAEHCLVASITDGGPAVLEMHDDSGLNTPWYWRLRPGLKLFWDYFWNKEHYVELVLNRDENSKWKKFFGNLEEGRCENCDPGYK